MPCDHVAERQNGCSQSQSMQVEGVTPVQEETNVVSGPVWFGAVAFNCSPEQVQGLVIE